jgi:hypothetical protein
MLKDVDFHLSGPSLQQHLATVVQEMFFSRDRDLMGLPRVPGDELVQVGGQDCSLIVTYLAVINISADPPEAMHSSNFHFS